MRVDVSAAMEYLQGNFTLSGEAIRMAYNLLAYVSGHAVDDPAGLVMDVFDGFGFEQSDLDKMMASGIINPGAPDIHHDTVSKEEDADMAEHAPRLVRAEFTSLWDDGETSVSCPCLVNMDTREITGIDMGNRVVSSADDDVDADNVDDAVDVLDREYVTIDGEEYDAVPSDGSVPPEDGAYWYAAEFRD